MSSILVVEDEALLLWDISDELRSAGYIVYEARNADEAIVQLERHQEISVLFTDIDMPGSMNGLKLSHAVRDRWPPVKIVITSGMKAPHAEHLPSGGVFLPKPYRVSTVTKAIQQLLN